MQGQAFLGMLDGVRKTGESAYSAKCPAHDDHEPSLSVTLREDRIIVHCFSCKSGGQSVCEALGIELGELFYDYRKPVQPLTIETFAAAKFLPLPFLAEHGIRQERNTLLFKYLRADGQKADRQRIRLALTAESQDKRFIWTKGQGKPIPYGLWRLREMRKLSGDLFLVEGESDALTLWLYELAALGIPGNSLTETLQEGHLDGFSRVFIVKETKGGEPFEDGLKGRLAALNYDGEVRLLDMADLGAKDPNELHCKAMNNGGHFREKWLAAADAARKIDLPVLGLEIVWADTVISKPVEWLWENRVPLGKLTVFAGDPDLGKSYVTCDMAARLSTGEMTGEPGKTLIFSGEDSKEDTIVPRLASMGANLKEIGIIDATRKALNGQIIRRGFNLVTDLDDIRRPLRQRKDVRLVVIDPIASYLGGAKGNDTVEMRALVLTPLAKLAEEFNVAVVCVMHLNKDKDGTNPKYRVAGSLAMVAASRMAWMFVKYGTDKTAMVLIRHAICPWGPGLSYRIEQTSQAGVVMWDEQPVMARVEELMAPKEERD